jgi:hypothetical protein
MTLMMIWILLRCKSLKKITSLVNQPPFPNPVSQDSLANVPLGVSGSASRSPDPSQVSLWSCYLGTSVPTPSFSNVVKHGPLLHTSLPVGVAAHECFE